MGRIFSSSKCTAAGVITNTDLLTVNEHGIICWARINLDGELVKFDPPQTMIAIPLQKGASWDFNGQAGEVKVHQHYDVVGEEDINVPAGKFHAFRIYGEQTSPSRDDDRSLVRKRCWNRQRRDDDARLPMAICSSAFRLSWWKRPKISARPEVKSNARRRSSSQ